MSLALPVLVYDPSATLDLGSLDKHYHIHAFQTLQDAVAGLSHLHPDVVVAQLDESALELCETVAERDVRMPVLLVGEPDPALIIAAIRAGARDVIVRDGSWRSVLQSRIEAALGWRRSLEKDTEAQVQSFIVQSELYQERAKDLVTKNRELETQLRAESALVTQTQRQLELQRELAMAAVRAKSAFLANISHELNTPLNAIINYAELLREDVDAARYAEVDAIIDSSGRLLGLLQEVVNLTRLESGQVHPIFEPSSVSEVIAVAVERHRANALAKDVVIEVAVPKGIGTVTTDPSRLGQALHHLLDNAIKYGKSRVRVSASRLRDRSVTVTVEDDGPGFGDVDWDSVVGTFNQSDDSSTKEHGGLGMGLAVANQLARVLGGFLTGTGDSSGAVLSLTLPDVDDRNVQVGSDHERTILVVDDDPVIRKILQHMLVADGHSVVTTAHPAEALELARTHRPSLVLLDVLLPGTDGITLLQQFKSAADLAQLPVVMLSSTEANERSHQNGAVAFLQKPVSREALQGAIDLHALVPPDRCGVLDGAASSGRIVEALGEVGLDTFLLALDGLDEFAKSGRGVLVLPTDLPMTLAKRALHRLGGVRDLAVFAFGEGLSDDEYNFLNAQFTGVVDPKRSEDVEAVLQAR